MATLTRRPVFALYLIATLAVLQAVVALLRSFELFQIGTDLTGRGVLFIPLMGLITVARGGLAALVAVLYILFAWGGVDRKKLGMVGRLPSSDDQRTPRLERRVSGRGRSAFVGLGHRAGVSAVVSVRAGGACAAEAIAAYTASANGIYLWALQQIGKGRALASYEPGGGRNFARHDRMLFMLGTSKRSRVTCRKDQPIIIGPSAVTPP